MQTTYKTIDLFGEEHIHFVEKKKNTNKTLFDDYEGFVDKFLQKKTTDDCYTPAAIYDMVLSYVRNKCNIDGKTIVRPFCPGGDYENISYNDNMVVVDNPPFSILSQIIRYYLAKGIKFFLFAPHLTLFGSNQDYTSIVAGCDIIYENRAKVKTSFVSNMMGDLRVVTAPELYQKCKDINDKRKEKAELPLYVYPANVLTVTSLDPLIKVGREIEITKDESQFCRGLESQKAARKAIFGSGFLVSNAAAERLVAERLVAERLVAERLAITWDLSEKEKAIIERLQ